MIKYLIIMLTNKFILCLHQLCTMLRHIHGIPDDVGLDWCRAVLKSALVTTHLQAAPCPRAAHAGPSSAVQAALWCVETDHLPCITSRAFHHLKVPLKSFAYVFEAYKTTMQ